MTPNPGSFEAHEQGCICPGMDNGRGRGIGTDENGKTLFIITGGCPLHDTGDKPWFPNRPEE